MAAKFNWVWHPFGTMATPTLQRSLKPLLFAGAARRGGLQASGMRRRDIEREYQQGELEWEGVERSEEDPSDDDGPSITCEETE